MRDFIYDDDGYNIAYIEDGFVFSTITKKKIAILTNSELFLLNGSSLGMYLENAFRVRGEGEATPAAFIDLIT